MLLTFLSAVFGGFLRLAPELLKYLDRGADRTHELEMQDKQLAFLQATNEAKVSEAHIQADSVLTQAHMDAIVAANTSQAQMAQSSGVIVAALSALVRPTITFLVFGMWAVHKIATMVYAWQLTGNSTQVLMNMWDVDSAAMLSMILSFWFVGRVIEKDNQQA